MEKPEVTGDKTASTRRTRAARQVHSGFVATFSSLSNRNFRYLWFGQVGAATAMHADLIARSWLVFELTGSSLAVAGVNVARAVPML